MPPQQLPYAPQRNGTVAWALGFLTYIPIPLVGFIVTAIVELCVGLAQRKHGGLAARNGVRAANWGLTKLTVLVIGIAALVAITSVGMSPSEPGAIATPRQQVGDVLAVVWAICLVAFGIVVTVHTILGTVRATKGRDVGLVLIPFIPAPQDSAQEPGGPVPSVAGPVGTPEPDGTTGPTDPAGHVAPGPYGPGPNSPQL